MFSLTIEERDRRWKNIRQTMEKRKLECLVVWGAFGRQRNLSANLAYLSNLNIEGYLVFPLKDDPTIFGFQGGFPTAWIKDNRTGHPLYAKRISERLAELHLERARIGLVGISGYEGELGFPYSNYVAIAANCPKAHLEDATDIVEEARVIKSPIEIRCLEYGSEVGDKIIQDIINTAKPGVKDYEVRAKIVGTLLKEGCDPGSMILYDSGKEMIHGSQGSSRWAVGQRTLEQGDIIHTEFDVRYLGYKAQFNQPFSLGKPSKEWQDIFDVAIESVNTALNVLKPGITVGQLHEAFLPPIKRAGYRQRTPNFHGLGLSLEEPFGPFPGQPDFQPNNNRVIEPNTVLEFEPPVISPDFKRGTTIGCPILVTEKGYRLLSKNWKPGVKVI